MSKPNPISVDSTRNDANPLSIGAQRRRSPKWVILGTATATILGGASAVILPRIAANARPTSAEQNPLDPSPQVPALTDGTSEPEPAESEAEVSKTHSAMFHQEQLVGRWLREGKIRRDVVMHPGGTATMTVTLDYLSSLLYGREMQLTLSWNLEDDVLTYSIVDGTPKANVDRVIRDFGDSISYRVVKVSPSEIVLKEDDGTDHVQSWKAIR